LVVLTSDRGLCGSFNTSINKLAEEEWRRRTRDGQQVFLLVIGRKGRDYFRRRNAPLEYVPGVWDKLDWDTARTLGRQILQHFLRPRDPVDAIYLVYNEFKSAMTQKVVAERLLPVADAPSDEEEADEHTEFLFEPSEEALLGQLVPMYLQVSILRALLESMASELGARMTAMDAATNNASEMIADLTLQYNRARQAAITKELMEIIGGSEALKG
jgi:F-type H+-transporting ATPase subunit gamma